MVQSFVSEDPLRRLTNASDKGTIDNGPATHFLHRGQHPWLAIVVSISPDSEVNFLIVCIRFERGCQLENAKYGQLTRHAIGYSLHTCQEELEGLPAMFLIPHAFISCLLPHILAHLLTSFPRRDDSVIGQFCST